jgi:hypothetical protein
MKRIGMSSSDRKETSMSTQQGMSAIVTTVAAVASATQEWLESVESLLTSRPSLVENWDRMSDEWRPFHEIVDLASLTRSKETLLRLWDRASELPEGYCSFIRTRIEKALEAEHHPVDNWFARNDVGNVEWGHPELRADLGEDEEGIPVDLPPVQDGTWWEDQLSRDAKLFNVEEHTFSTKEEAVRFVTPIRNAFKKGEHSKQVLRTKVERGSFIAPVLVADMNWGHRKWMASRRDEIVEKALERISLCTKRAHLQKMTDRARTYSKDSQALAKGNTKGVTTIGLDYRRYATVINAIVDRAKALGIPAPCKRMAIRDFEKKEAAGSEDILDRGAKVGVFMAEEVPVDTDFLFELLDEKKGIRHRRTPTKQAFRSFDCPLGKTTSPPSKRRIVA